MNESHAKIIIFSAGVLSAFVCAALWIRAVSVLEEIEREDARPSYVTTFIGGR